MPVVVSCSCGKQLRVPDAHAGKRIKCPGCGDPIQVPALEDEAPAPARAPKREAAAAAPATMIRFKCPECGKQMQAKAEHAGAATACPACKAEVDIPAADAGELERAGIRADKPSAKKVAAGARGKGRDEDEDEDDRPARRGSEEEEDEDDRPRSKKGKGKKKGGMLLLLLGGGAAALLLFCGVGGFLIADYFWLNLLFGGANDLAMVPSDAQGFVTIRVADTWKLDGTQRQWKQMKDQLAMGGDDPLKEMQDKTGLKPEDVERLTFVAADVEKQEFWVIVSTRGSYDKKKLLDSFKGNREVKHEGTTYYTGSFSKTAPPMRGGPGGGPKGMPGGMPGGMAANEDALYFASSKVFVFAPDKGMKRLLGFMAGKKLKGPLDEAIKRAKKKDYHILGAINLPSSIKMQAKNAIPPEFTRFGSLLEFQSATMVVKGGTSTKIEIIGHYATDAQAAEAKKALDDVRSLARVGMGKGEEGLKGNFGNASGKQMADSLKKTLDDLTIEQKGSNVTINMSIDDKAFEGIAPRPGGGRPQPFPKKGKF